jgi:hypothetical protein
VRLRGAGGVHDEGYDASVGGLLTLRFARGRIHQQIVTGP